MVPRLEEVGFHRVEVTGDIAAPDRPRSRFNAGVEGLPS
jgi:hypothetical protein